MASLLQQRPQARPVGRLAHGEALQLQILRDRGAQVGLVVDHCHVMLGFHGLQPAPAQLCRSIARRVSTRFLRGPTLFQLFPISCQSATRGSNTPLRSNTLA